MIKDVLIFLLISVGLILAADNYARGDDETMRQDAGSLQSASPMQSASPIDADSPLESAGSLQNAGPLAAADPVQQVGPAINNISLSVAPIQPGMTIPEAPTVGVIFSDIMLTRALQRVISSSPRAIETLSNLVRAVDASVTSPSMTTTYTASSGGFTSLVLSPVVYNTAMSSNLSPN